MHRESGTNNYRLLTEASKSLKLLAAWLKRSGLAKPIFTRDTAAVSRVASFVFPYFDGPTVLAHLVVCPSLVEYGWVSWWSLFPARFPM